MRSRTWFTVSAMTIALAVFGCDDDDDPTGPLETFRATLNGQSEVPPRTTSATGTAEIRLDDANTLSWTVNLTGITNMTAAHIHRTPADRTNGPIVLFLTNPTAPPTSNTLITGSVTRTECVAPVCVGATFDEIVALLRTTDGSYVNVHTDNPTTNPSNTGPGDFPAGEIRGFAN